MNQLTISKKSWHYKLYNFSYRVWNEYPCDTGNLCQYVRRLMFLPLSLAIVSIYISLFCILAILLGYYPYRFVSSDDLTDAFRSYDSNSKVKAWYVSVSLLFIGINYVCYTHGSLGRLWLIIGSIVGVILLVVSAVLIGLGALSETFVGKYFQAKTAGICPLIKFKDE